MTAANTSGLLRMTEINNLRSTQNYGYIFMNKNI